MVLEPTKGTVWAKIQWPTFLLAFSMFMTGAAGIINEYILGTVASYLLGNTVEQLTFTFGLMLLMMGVGGYCQRFLKHNLVQKFILLELLLALLGAFAPLAIFATFGYLGDHFLLVLYFFIIAIGFLIGFEIPMVLRINKDFNPVLSDNIANIYMPDYLGAFIGTLVWIRLLSKIPMTEMAFIIAISNLLVATITWAYFVKQKLVSHRPVWTIAIVLTQALLLFGYANNRGWSATLEQSLYEDKIIFTQTTKYQHLVLTHYKELDEYRLYINGNLQFSSYDEKIYHENLVHPAMSLNRHQQVLILGGGDGLALREVLKYPAVKKVTLVDLDPAMTKLFSTNPVLTQLNQNSFADARLSVLAAAGVSAGRARAIYQETGAERDGTATHQKVADVRVLNLDADIFVSRISTKFDVIIIDLPDPSSIDLTKLYSREFYLKLKRLLATNGVIAIQATSPYHAKESYLCIKRTLEAAGLNTLPYHDNVPSFGEWGWFLAQVGPPITPESLAQLTAFGAPTSYLTPARFKANLTFGKTALSSAKTSVNTLFNPVLLSIYLDESWLVQ